MGVDNKFLVEVYGKVMVCYVVENVFLSFVGDVMVVFGYEGEVVKVVFFDFDVEFVVNLNFVDGLSILFCCGFM